MQSLSKGHTIHHTYAVAYYRSQIENPTNTSLDGLDQALVQVLDLVGNGKATVVLAVDLNCPDSDWDRLSQAWL